MENKIISANSEIQKMIMKPMRIAVILSEVNPEAGGAFTFEESLRNVLENLSRPDLKFYFYAAKSLQVQKLNKWGQCSTILQKGWTKICNFLGLVSLAQLNKVKRELALQSLSFDEYWDTDNSLNREIVADGCQMAYFVTPTIVPVSLPFVATHWDLGHRRLQMFPELSLTGWTWGKREWYYTHWLLRATTILTGTETGKNELARSYGILDGLIRVNPFPIPDWITKIEETCGVSSLEPGTFLYYPAQFWPHKNHVLLLDVLSRLKASGSKITLVFTGSDKGNRTYIEALVDEMNLRERVFFLGFVKRSELLWLYRNALLMVFPCLLGPDNLPPLEGLAAGGKIAVADIPGARDYVSPDQVLFFDPVDAGSLAELVTGVQNGTVKVPIGGTVGLASTKEYVAKVCDIFQELVLYRRCWGSTYQHK